MLRPEEQLQKFSFDDEVYHVLRTPNRLKPQKEQLQGWQNLSSPPVQSTQRNHKHNNRHKFVIKPHKQRLDNTQNSKNIPPHPVQNKQNHPTSYRDYQLSMKMLKLIDQQLLSPKSRKIITPNRLFRKGSKGGDSQCYDTPKTVRKDNSLKKLYVTERVGKLCYSEKRRKDNNQEDDGFWVNAQASFRANTNCSANVNATVNTNANEQTSNINKETFKIPLSAILYPVLKMNSKRPHRRIERFHSFVARTVRK